jgi:RNA polymerase sigma-70 factor, ECF subfamily
MIAAERLTSPRTPPRRRSQSFWQLQKTEIRSPWTSFVKDEWFRLAFAHLANFKGNSRLSTWLSNIVTNAALMTLRKDDVHRQLSLDQSSESQPRFSPLDCADRSLTLQFPV